MNITTKSSLFFFGAIQDTDARSNGSETNLDGGYIHLNEKKNKTKRETEKSTMCWSALKLMNLFILSDLAAETIYACVRHIGKI